MEHNPKFKVKADLALFEAIQKDGRLSEEGIAKETGISSTTVHYAMERIKERNFFAVKAVPLLEKFSEIPMAVIGFANIHPLKINELKQKYAVKHEVMQFLHSEKDVIMLVTDVSMDSLTKKLFDIMAIADEKPSIYITSPMIAKCNITIPDKVLESVYPDLPDRRIKV
jgi:DNA-binding Lrp family transcriptional regulator